ncbi:hypothetical protein B0H14DRAFT_27480, partial [Mycena olivaceomarginata]
FRTILFILFCSRPSLVSSNSYTISVNNRHGICTRGKPHFRHIIKRREGQGTGSDAREAPWRYAEGTWARREDGGGAVVTWRAERDRRSSAARAVKQRGAGVAAGEGHGGADTERDGRSETETGARTGRRRRLDGTGVAAHGRARGRTGARRGRSGGGHRHGPCGRRR